MVHHASSNPPPTLRDVRIASDGFVSDAAIREWERTGAAVFTPGILACTDGRKFLLADALRVLGPRTSEMDRYGLTGRVSTLRELLSQGFILRDDCLRLGNEVYDVEYGFVARQMGSANESGAYQRARS